VGRVRHAATVGAGLLGVAATALVVNALVVSGSGAQVRPQVSGATTQAEPAGNNFTIHTSVDPNFCFTDVSEPDANRETSIQQCASNDNDEWTFAQSVDGSSVLVDASGQCLEAAKKAGKLAEANPCTFLSPEHFLYTAKGQIKTASGNMCLQDAQAASDAGVTFETCVKGLSTQIWQLGH
jgi:Ricin-type beta-trefoil lectin domain